MYKRKRVKYLNLKKKLTLAQEVRQKSDISDRKSEGWGYPCPLQILLCLQYRHWVTMRPLWGPVNQKINTMFLSINNFKKKKKR